MPYLIDGHNLIPKIPGMNLSDPDDELRLAEMLQEYLRLQRKDGTVFFDKAPPGSATRRKVGRLTVRFVAENTTADAAILQKLRRIGREASNWTVVTSDGKVRSQARAFGARVVSSEQFSRELLRSVEEEKLGTQGKATSGEERKLSEEEVEEWLRLFGGGDDQIG